MTLTSLGFGVPDVDFEDAFEKSFQGMVRNNEVYYDPHRRVGKGGINKMTDVWQKIVSDAKERLKTVSVGSPTFSAGSQPVMIPVYPDPNIVDLTVKDTPLVSLLPRFGVRGKSYDFIQQSATANGRWLPERSAIPDRLSTRGRATVQMKYGYAKGSYTGPSQAAMRGFIDASALELEDAARAFRYLEENTIINGNTAGTESESAPYNGPNSFQGLIQSITTNSTAVSAAVQLSDIRTAVEDCWNNGGRPTIAVTDGYTHAYIKGLLQDFQRSVEPITAGQDLAFGIPSGFKFDELMFVKSRFMPTTSTQRRILLIDPRYVGMGVLQDMTYETKVSDADEYPFILKAYEALVVKHEAACAQLTTIT